MPTTIALLRNLHPTGPALSIQGVVPNSVLFVFLLVVRKAYPICLFMPDWKYCRPQDLWLRGPQNRLLRARETHRSVGGSQKRLQQGKEFDQGKFDQKRSPIILN